MDPGTIILVAFITPLEGDRKKFKEIVGEENYLEIFVNSSSEECEKAGCERLMYKKARAGEIQNPTGIDSPFEITEGHIW